MCLPFGSAKGPVNFAGMIAAEVLYQVLILLEKQRVRYAFSRANPGLPSLHEPNRLPQSVCPFRSAFPDGGQYFRSPLHA